MLWAIEKLLNKLCIQIMARRAEYEKEYQQLTGVLQEFVNTIEAQLRQLSVE